ncbi:AAA family ATPase [Mycobacterium sp. CVI_P3]|uniref:AAA family ATPase n=1 Tax=Mycobacterium pinniadriaticum TaxID=2994102 RepID=A0ABT3SAD4_9MYCO|nr:AAA family ATPase [Mycobacterium pinniadriaticum]MCX2929886.1 AAA family ATPase [Mycobacterium pinniadriaticum]MCX2936465.1 AAA family ATPase [Mycobacterium pinniadriaticum]
MTDPVATHSDEQWPFVGRAGILEELEQRLFQGGRSMMLAGAAGVGKSRLAAQLLDAAEEKGLATIRTTATRPAAEIPFGAFAGVLFTDDEPLPKLVSAQAEWMRRAVRRLAAIGQNRPVVVLIDDVQLLDPVSAIFIHQAVVAGACTLVATMRTADPVPSPVVSLYKDGHVTRVDIGAVESDEIAEILRAVLGAVVESSVVQQFAMRSGGNILYLRELVRGALRSGTLLLDDDVWRLIGKSPLSARLMELVGDRLAELSAEERSVLDALAFGEPLQLRHLEACLPGAGEVVDALETQGLVISRSEGRRLVIRLAHPVYADVLLHNLTAVRRSRLARTLAEVSQDTADAGVDDVIRAASWSLEGGLHRPALMLRAACHARWSYDFGLATRLARAAAEDGAGFEAELLGGQLAYLQGRAGDAEAVLARLAEAADTDDARTRVALARLECAMFSGHIELGITIAEHAEAATGATQLRDQITARRAGLILAATGPDAAVRVSAPLLVTSQGPALVWACLVTSAGYGRTGDVDKALEAAELGHGAQATLTTPLDNYPWLHIFFRGEAQIYAGDFGSALATAREHYDDAVAQGSIEAQAYFAWQLGKTVGEQGDVGESLRYSREAALLFRDLGRPALREQCLIDVVIALAIGGDGPAAAAALAELEKLRLPRSYYAVEVLRARAWTHIANGDLSSARDSLEQGAALGERIGDRVGALECLHILARVRSHGRIHARAEEVAQCVQGPLARARLENIRALEAKDWQGLESVAQSFYDLGAYLLAAEAASEAVVTARKKEVTTQRLAGLRRTAARFRQHCLEATTPALQTAQLRTTLTNAEADAARLAAGGLSNKRIAEKLCLSTRTVEGQLQRAYEKLCIGGRSELAAALSDIS